MKASQASVAPRLATTRAVAAITPATAAHANASPQDESASAGLLGSSLLLIRDQTAVVASRAAQAAATADKPTRAFHTSFSLNVPPMRTTYLTQGYPIRVGDKQGRPAQDSTSCLPMECVWQPVA